MSKYLIINVLGEPIVSAQKLPLSGSMRTQSDGIVSCRVPQVLCGLLFLAGAVRAQTPSVAVERPAGPVRVGRSCYVTYTVTWAGAADAYSVFPGQFDPVDWGRLALTHVVGAGTADGPQVVQTLEIIPEKTGEYTVPEIRFVYHPASQPPTPPEHPDSASHVSAPSAPPLAPRRRVSPPRSTQQDPGMDDRRCRVLFCFVGLGLWRLLLVYQTLAAAGDGWHFRSG
ncbi:MAG: hypothetical protein HY706_12085 [Candidatus Hydrogenedentes bacterium]|nr:hypothetical protein [Candidatus Hydrogenedentota bacterium]